MASNIKIATATRNAMLDPGPCRPALARGRLKVS